MSKKYIVTVPDDFLFTEGYGQYLSVEPYEGDKYKHALAEMLYSFEKAENQIQEKIDSIIREIGISEFLEFVKDRYEHEQG